MSWPRWGGAVGCGEAGLGGESGGVADLGDDVGGDEGPDTVDAGEAGGGFCDGDGDLVGELRDGAVEAADAGDAVCGDCGPRAGVAAQQPDGGVEASGAGEGRDPGVVSAADLLNGAVEPVDGRCAVFHEFAAVADQTGDLVCAAGETRRRQVVVAGGGRRGPVMLA